ncbi:MAG TPA: ADP-ribosylglycohydrolase family protein [Firmicutes bacterium]|nr:ADP-ribosylglycohydrolase family protein [Bacillota bacterium]
MTNKLPEKIYGCLMGVAVGDAMGMPSSLLTRAEIKEQLGCIDGFLPAPEGHLIHNGMLAGSVTDDTGQTLAVAKAIIADGGKVVPESIGREILAWAEREGALAEDSMILGPSSRRALLQLKDGVSPTKAGMFGDTNGAAMRISPVGMIHPGDVKGAVADTELCCLPTHGTSVAISGAAAVSCAIAVALESTGSLNEIVTAAKKGAEMGATRGRMVAAPSIARRIDWALDMVTDADEKTACQDLYELVGTTVAITETVPVALALVLLAQGDPTKTALLAANLGGDCDTVGAIACSIAGAYAGIDAFPSDLIQKIEEVNKLGLKDIALALSKVASTSC